MASGPATTWQQPPAADNPMATHVKVVAIVYLVFGAFAAIGALLVLAGFLTGAGLFADSGAGGLAGFLAGLGLFLFVIVAAFAVLYLVAGMLLLRRRRAGKGWGIAAAIPSLLSFPIGTAIAVYALVILTRPDTERLLSP
jgi:hypothetical protein